MHPLLQALLSQWEWRLEIIAVLVLFGATYIRGWLHLRRTSRHSRLANIPRLGAYLGGLVVLAISLLSPIDRLGSQLFFMHMIQHLLTMMIAAPLLWLATPFPIILWGCPRAIRLRIAVLFQSESSFRRLLRFVTRPVVAWLTFLTIYLGWHDPTLYDLALRRDWIHDVQHITFFGAAMLYWWHAIGGPPRIHSRFPGWARMAYLLATIPPNMAIGVSIAFATDVLYPYYLTVPRIWGYTALQDQMISGAIMWIPGSMMFIVAALVVLARLFAKHDTPNARLTREWTTEEMIAPGLEHRVIQEKWQIQDS